MKRLTLFARPSPTPDAGAAARFPSLDMIFPAGLFLAAALHGASGAAAIDESKLPPPAARPVDFLADVQPIFERSCFRCHGPEKPKSHFRLDNRVAALRGGDKGTAVLPGQSGKSPLIHYVARLPEIAAEDMEMPPEGKGEPLTAAQVGILRAWIDQGAVYPGTNLVSGFNLSITPTAGWISVHGDKKKFRENEWTREDWNAGVLEFELKDEPWTDTRFSASGHALRNDYQVELSLEKNRFGYVRAGFSEFRKYYDDTGGFYEGFDPAAYSLGRDLHLDLGKAWFDAGIILPNQARIEAGYEYDFRHGAKSTLQWGNVGGAGGIGGTGGKNLYPAAEEIDEAVHIVKVNLAHEIAGWTLEDNARVEFYDLKTFRANVENFGIGPRPESTVNSREEGSHIEGMNTLRLEKQINDWVFLSGGYLYSRMEGDASFDQTTVDAAGLPAKGTFWYSDEILLKRVSHIFSVSGTLSPSEGFTASAALQNEWTHQEGFGRAHLDEGDPYLPGSFIQEFPTLDSNLDKRLFAEQLILRYARIPFTSLYAEARLAQEDISQIEGKSEGDHAFDRDTDASNNRRDFKVGFTTSPWPTLSLNGSYKNSYDRTDYLTRTDVPPLGYPSFIRERKIDGDELQLKLVLRPARWLKTTFSYQIVARDFDTSTDPVSVPGPLGPDVISPGGRLLSGNYDAQVYGAGFTFTRVPRLIWTATGTYGDYRTRTGQNDHPTVIPYQNDIYSLLTSATYNLNPKTDLTASYYFSKANFDRNRLLDAVPLGLDYSRHGLSVGIARQWTSYLSSNLRYAYYKYSEPGAGSVNGYTAHGVFATFKWAWH